MVTPVIAPGGEVPPDVGLYRALNPVHYENGLPGDNHFVIRRNCYLTDDGLSTGMDCRISLEQLRQISCLQEVCGPEFGVAHLEITAILEKVAEHKIPVVVRQQDDETWQEHRSAHAIVTLKQALVGNDQKKKFNDFQRYLVRLARQRFYPPSSAAPIGAE